MLRHFCKVAPFCIVDQRAKKVIFTACHSGKLKQTFTSPNIISTSPKNISMSRLISQFFCNLNSSKKFTCPSGKLITKFTSSIAKSTSPGLSALLSLHAGGHTYPLTLSIPTPSPQNQCCILGPQVFLLLQTTLIWGVRGFTAFKRNKIIIELNV